MAEIHSITELTEQNEALQPLAELLTQIMELPDANLNQDVVEVLSGMIGGAFTDNIQREAINAVIKSFEDEEMTRADAARVVEESRKIFSDFIDELKPSDQKRQLIDSIFNQFYYIFDTAFEKYHSYDIVLPIKLERNAKTPTYAHENDAAADLYAIEDMTLPAHSLSNLIDTGVRIQLPENYVAYVVPRSSIGLKTGLRLSNSVAVIDSEYRGTIGVIYDNISDSDYTIHAGDRIAQLIVAPAYHFKPQVVDILSSSERGEGGYGSTGV